MSVKIEKTADKIKVQYKNYSFEIDRSQYEANLDEIIRIWLEQIKKLESEAT